MKTLKWTGTEFLIDENPADPPPLAIEHDVDVVAADLKIDDVDTIVLNFPSFRDGRAFSQARALREMGYVGDIRAMGGLFLDQYGFAVRCGFTSFVGDDLPTPAQAAAVVARYPIAYQRGGQTPRAAERRL